MGVQNFTPGPWGFDSFGLSEEIKSLNNPLIAIVQSRHCESPEEMRGNAQLIASAPDLLDAAQTALECLEGGGFGKAYAEDVLRAAIRKAEG